MLNYTFLFIVNVAPQANVYVHMYMSVRNVRTFAKVFILDDLYTVGHYAGRIWYTKKAAPQGFVFKDIHAR